MTNDKELTSEEEFELLMQAYNEGKIDNPDNDPDDVIPLEEV